MDAVTFAFWNVLFVEDSDEDARRRAGLPAKSEARRDLFVVEVRTHHPELETEQLVAAYEHARSEYRRWWEADEHTPSVARVLAEGLAFLGITPTPGFDGMVQAVEQMQLQVEPDLVEGASACLRELASRHRLGVVGDTSVTPGRCLRTLLSRRGLDAHLGACAFSDEVGARKPARAAFAAVFDALAVEPERLVHVGPVEATDIAGAKAAGARAVLFTGGGEPPTHTDADAVCRRLEQLPGILAGL